MDGMDQNHHSLHIQFATKNDIETKIKNSHPYKRRKGYWSLKITINPNDSLIRITSLFSIVLIKLISLIYHFNSKNKNKY
jgi:hypothetical protein